MDRLPPQNTIQITSGSIIRAVAIVIGFYTLFLLKDVLLVVILSIVVASGIEPGVKWLARRNVPRLLSVILMYLLLTVFIIGVVYFLFLPILSETANFLASLPAYLSDLRVWNPADSETGIFSSNGKLGAISQTFSLVDVVNQLDTITDKVSKGFFSAISSVFGGILSFILVIVLSFYLSVESNGVSNFLSIAIPSKYEDYIVGLWERSQRKIGLWMQGQIVLAIIVAVLVFLGLTLLRVENALLLAVIAGVFEIIPLFGPILAAIPAIAIALVSGGVGPALMVVGLYIIVQQFENQLIYPLVVRKIVGVPPIVSILALVIGGQLGGFVGLIISVPIAAALMEFLNDIEKDKKALRGSVQ